MQARSRLPRGTRDTCGCLPPGLRDELLDVIALLRQENQYSQCAVMLLDPTREEFVDVTTSTGARTERLFDPAAARDALATRGAPGDPQPIVVYDEVQPACSARPHRSRPRRTPQRVRWAVPILDATGDTAGGIVVCPEEARRPVHVERTRLRRAAALVGSLLRTCDEIARLAERERRFRTFADESPGGVIVHTRGDIEYVNRAALDAFGWRGRRPPRSLHRMVPADVAAQLVPGAEVSVDVAASAPSGPRLVCARVTALGGERTATLLITCHSRSMSAEAEVLAAVERERARLASDLHDGLGQELTGVNLLLGSIRQRLRHRGEDADRELARAIELVSTAIARTRLLASSSFPLDVRQGGLYAALEGLAARARDAGQVTLLVEAPGRPDRRLPPALATQVFRVAQEALNNAMRHSGASTIRIALRARRGDLVLEVTDDGSGLGNGEAAEDGLGIRSMRYRASLLGGALNIDPIRPTGTRLRLHVPMRARDEAMATTSSDGPREIAGGRS
jgi:signal transduction histidine kinase